jgi:hypothetical protein
MTWRSLPLRSSFVVLSISAALVCTGFGSRKPPAAQICADVPVQLDADVETALARLLNPEEVKQQGNRKLASLNKRKKSPLSEQEQKVWLNWAEDKIEETQEAIDLAENDPKLRTSSKELARASLRLVEFHGYAQKGDRAKMVLTLERVRKHGKKAGKTACKPL